MKNIRIIVSLAFLFIYGCTSDVERINKEIDKQFDNQLSVTLKPVVATMSFYYYANPENYWYPDGTTTKEILNDEFKTGYKNLSKLDNVIGEIQTDNSKLISAIDTLHFKILKAQKDIRKAQKTLEQVNSIFGFGLFGGMNTLYDFGALSNSNNEDEVETMQIPKEVKDAFENLNEVIFQSGREFFKKTYEFEINLIGTKEITDAQILEVRSYLKQAINTKVKQYYTDNDTVARNEAIKNLVESYDKLFPPENIIISEYGGIQSLIKNGDFVLPTNTFIVSTNLKKAASIESDEYEGDIYIWKLDNGIVLSTNPSSDGEINYISINCENNSVISGLPYDLTFNKTTLQESQTKFEKNTPQKLPTYENGNQNGYWLKFKKDKYWVYLSFNKSSILYSILLATFEIDQTS